MEVPIISVIWLFSGLIGVGVLISTVKNISSSLKEIKDDVRDFKKETLSRLQSIEEKTNSNINQIAILQKEIEHLTKHNERIEDILIKLKDDVRDLSTRQATSLSIGVVATPRTPAITGSPEQHIIENNKENNN